jgi:hypothetical protein
MRLLHRSPTPANQSRRGAKFIAPVIPRVHDGNLPIRTKTSGVVSAQATGTRQDVWDLWNIWKQRGIPSSVSRLNAHRLTAGCLASVRFSAATLGRAPMLSAYGLAVCPSLPHLLGAAVVHGHAVLSCQQHAVDPAGHCPNSGWSAYLSRTTAILLQELNWLRSGATITYFPVCFHPATGLLVGGREARFIFSAYLPRRCARANTRFPGSSHHHMGKVGFRVHAAARPCQGRTFEQ